MLSFISCHHQARSEDIASQALRVFPFISNLRKNRKVGLSQGGRKQLRRNHMQSMREDILIYAQRVSKDRNPPLYSACLEVGRRNLRRVRQ